ncbi:conserved hypothetical protein [Leishmania infantum JPCM5]|uniref:Uncharacterized protein n=2 Tax=Leishmania infantum TaxID=5671 RepID=A4I8E5_LEIIN|nr:conserved hypothetical protein [Leishmania infantum JPCM5]CAC9527653.1 hypothetical_protein_-_conserved [Leishmania infantum]CAM71088.1 conserved hypothetical protein [Leishmania infantum JPCM5]SUZ44911.1 hypothetical_protein_-_conserved [Leishmania infantum]|eukprot:XP_001468014.1 conserved hypothetical protein [Leishmania infantum JPCM5]
MSEVLLKQLKQVLAPWESLPDKDKLDEGSGAASSMWAMPPPAAPNCASSTSSVPPQFAPVTKCTSVGWPSEEAAAAYVAHSRTATTKLELARAALALFSSNAGVYRPFLVKLLRFLFDHVDELREEQGQLRMEWWMWQQGSGSSTSKAADGDGGGDGLVVITPEERNAVAAAYEKVRMTEARMAALVEEAAVQRDHFKSQMGMQKRHQHHLEDLLCHQIELTQTLLDHRLHQDLISGKQSTAVTAVAAVTHILQDSRGVAGAGLGDGGDDHGRGTREGSTSARLAAVTPRDISGLECSHASIRPPERRDAAYVQRLISRAEKELLLERTEDQLRDLRAQYDRLQNKVQSLLKLNSRYARQSVELSARLSILHEHNIALAADVQLFQRDYIRALQRAERLQRDLQVARGIALTMLHVQFGRQLSVGEEGSEDKRRASKEDNIALWQAGAAASRLSAPGKGGETRMRYAFETAEPLAPAAATAVTGLGETAPALGDKDTRGEEAQEMLDTESHAQESLHLAPCEGLRSQLQKLLTVSDPQNASIKASLLQNLHLSGDANLQGSCGDSSGFLFSSSGAQGWLSPASVPQWAPPYGLRPDVPLQLRSRSSVPLLHLHPVVAEVLVHELLSQRQELLWYSKQQQEERQAPLRMAEGRAWDNRGSRKASATTATTMFMSLQEYVGLFVLVVWLNRPDYYTYLLPPATQLTTVEDARARRGSRNGVVRNTASPSASATDAGDFPQPQDLGMVPTSLWDLRHVLHSVRLADDMEQLPAEGLQLTYALDTASLQLVVGPLTYAYGLTSRGALCDVLFDLLRAERFVFVELCRAVEAAILAKQEEEQERWAEARRQESQIHVARSKDPQLHPANPAAAAPPPPKPGPQSSTPLRGCIPVVQVARILLAMYPGYSATIMGQLIQTAVNDGTNVAENPAYLFYEVLLPSRMLPGPTTASMSIDPSMAVGTSFASLFYTAICDDALESMQVVEDSVRGFAYGHPHSSGMSALSSTSAAAVMSGASTATAQQLTSLAFLGVPRAEAQCWGPSLRSAIYRWPRLRSTIVDGPLVASAASADDAVLDGDAGATREVPAVVDDEFTAAAAAAAGRSDRFSLDSSVVLRAGTPSVHPTQDLPRAEDRKAAAEVSSVARVSVEEVVPYLRRHLLLRRGLYDWATSTAAAAVDISPPPVVEDGQAASKTLKTAVAKTTMTALATETEGAHHWSTAHSDLLRHWDARWAQYSGKTAGSPSALVGPTEPAEFKQMLKQVDPHRTCAWSSELLSRENPLMHPVTYDWTQGDPVKLKPPAREEDDSSSSR